MILISILVVKKVVLRSVWLFFLVSKFNPVATNYPDYTQEWRKKTSDRGVGASDRGGGAKMTKI